MDAEITSAQTQAQEAVHVTDMATSAAAALAKKASEAAAAIVEVAAEAHANMAPSVLVVSMFQSLGNQIERVDKRLNENTQRQVKAEADHAAYVANLASGIEDLKEKVGIQNGGVKHALEWMRIHDVRMAADESVVKGRKAQRADDVEKIDQMTSWFSRFWPALAGGGVVIVEVITRLHGFF